jgi:uncharacterized protein (DUF3084 family)
MENLKTFEEFNEDKNINPLNEANKDFRPESVRTREKITKLYVKSEDAISKARELDNNGDMLKAKIQQLTAESLRLKARAAEIDWRIKQLKEKQ